MSKPQFFYSNFQQPNVVITLRKLHDKSFSLSNAKVTILINVQRFHGLSHNAEQHVSEDSQIVSQYQISQPRPLKNGVACFYGESISIGKNILKFTISVYQVQETGEGSRFLKKKVLEVDFDEESLKQVYQRRGIFSTQESGIELLWEVKTQIQNCENISQNQNRSFEDFEDEEQLEQQQQDLILRRHYSPQPKRENRYSSFFYRDKINRRSEHHSQSPYKLTIETKQSFVHLLKKVRLATPIKKQKNQRSVDLKSFRRNNRQISATTQEDLILKNEQGNIREKKKLRIQTEIDEKESIIKSRISQTPKGEGSFVASGRTKRLLKLYDQISIKKILYTSIIGIIGGALAAHF